MMFLCWSNISQPRCVLKMDGRPVPFSSDAMTLSERIRGQEMSAS